MRKKITLFVFVFIAIFYLQADAPLAEAQGRGDGNQEVLRRLVDNNGLCGENEVVNPNGVGCIKAFTPLVGIPYIDTTDADVSLAKYVNALYIASISIAAFLAVVKIIFAGVKYMLSDVVTDKGAAKQDIRGALIGLLIVVGAVLILNTINPQLKGLQALEGPGVGITADPPHTSLDSTLEINTFGGENETKRVRKYISDCTDAERTVVIHDGVSCEQVTKESIVILDTDTTSSIEDQQDAIIEEYASQGLEELGVGIEVDIVLSDDAEIEQARAGCEKIGGSKMVLLKHNTEGIEYGRMLCFG